MKNPTGVITLLSFLLAFTASACNQTPAAAPPDTSTPRSIEASPTSPRARPTQASSPTLTPLPAMTPQSKPEDPAGWAVSGSPDPYNPGYTLYTLTEGEQQAALRPIREFYDRMYHAKSLLTPADARTFIDPASPAWTDPQEGYLASYTSFQKVGYYPYYEYPIEDAAHYTGWQAHGVKPSQGELTVVASFRMEEHGFTVFDQKTGKSVVSTPFWGPRLVVFETAYREGRWMILSRNEEDLGMDLTPTPTRSGAD
jgi:hypothetical protein